MDVNIYNSIPERWHCMRTSDYLNWLCHTHFVVADKEDLKRGAEIFTDHHLTVGRLKRTNKLVDP